MNRKPHSQLVKLELNLPIPEPAKEGIRSNVVPLVETMFKKSFKFYKGFLKCWPQVVSAELALRVLGPSN